MAKFGTPYRKDVESKSAYNKRYAARSLLESIDQPIASVKDYFGGAGIQVAECQLMFSPDRVLIQEWDDLCIERLQERFGGDGSVEVRKMDFFIDPCDDWYDLSLMDANCFTKLQWERSGRLREAFTRVAGQTDWILLTDIASAKLWLNYGSYGFEELPTVGEYLERMAETVLGPLGFQMVGFAGAREAMYSLHRRTELRGG